MKDLLINYLISTMPSHQLPPLNCMLALKATNCIAHPVTPKTTKGLKSRKHSIYLEKE